MIFPNQNQKIQQLVQGFITAHRIPHAILIEGENSTDNLNMALYIATAAVCDSNTPPCNNCKNCHMAQNELHPDIARITALDGKKFLSVDQIRSLRAEAFVKPHQAPHRVFVLEDAHRMNPQAQNALLKVLEEPPKNVIFILLVPSKTMLLDTIISRCVLLSLIGNDNNADYNELADTFIDLLLSGSEYDMLKILTPLEKSRTDAEQFFNTLALRVTHRLKIGSARARALDHLFDDIKYYLDLLTTNINMPLLMSLVVSRSKDLLDK